MTNGPMARACRCIRKLVECSAIVDLNDRQLLERFAVRKDEAAFAQLVRRHGPMVLRVCRRVLRNRHDAEDAFQATFLVLARKASSVRGQTSAAGWLFQVAYHLALKMKANVKRHRARVHPDVAGPDIEGEGPDWEARRILDEELNRLSEKYRTVLLLCHGEGKTRAEAARQLGWKEGTVKIRLERGRALLRARLARRGIVLSGPATGLLLARNATASVPPLLVRDTVACATAFASGILPPAVHGRSAVALANGALKSMTMTRIQIAVLLLLSASVAFIASGVGVYRALAQASNPVGPPGLEMNPEPQAGAAVRPPPDPKPEKPLRVLLFAGGPTREYQFLRSFFSKQAERKRLELSLHLQSSGPASVQDVPPDRLLKEFPARLDAGKNKAADDKSGNLAAYDVIVAFDPDWTKLTEEQGLLLERWVRKAGGGLLFIAGSVHASKLGRADPVPRGLQAILDLLPVRLADSTVEKKLPTDTPRPLKFPSAEKFLKLDDRGIDPLAGWSEFFFGTQRDDWQRTKDPPTRGFYRAYPVQSVKRGAKVIASFRQAEARIEGEERTSEEVPYLVSMQQDKGKVIYLGSGELWRLRQYNADFYDRLWSGLVRHAAAADRMQQR